MDQRGRASSIERKRRVVYVLPAHPRPSSNANPRVRMRQTAGRSAITEFRRSRRTAMRAAWLDWTGLALLLGAALLGVFLAGGTLQVISAWMAGFTMAVAVFGWMIGGHVSSLPWMWGATGERQTASQLERLPEGWHVVHDIPDGRGNWDHIAVGPAGVFAIDSKWFGREARVADDVLSSGRIRERGGTHRNRAYRLNGALAREIGCAPWVQAVVAVWGEFPQSVFKEQKVVYLDAARLVEWLRAQPEVLTAERVERIAGAPFLRRRG